jgi:hypothetical protein
MKPMAIVTIFFTFMAYSLNLFGDDEICTKYLTSENPVKTLKTLQQKEDPISQFCVGCMYARGIGTKKSIPEAVKRHY